MGNADFMSDILPLVEELTDECRDMKEDEFSDFRNSIVAEVEETNPQLVDFMVKMFNVIHKKVFNKPEYPGKIIGTVKMKNGKEVPLLDIKMMSPEREREVWLELAVKHFKDRNNREPESIEEAIADEEAFIKRVEEEIRAEEEKKAMVS